jgi:multidrug efflux pump subunit AcrA (membrane-fusion protein)
MVRRIAGSQSFGVATLLVLAVAGLASCSRQMPARWIPFPSFPWPRPSGPIYRMSLSSQRSSFPYQDVDVMAKVAGYVRAIRVDMGDHVREGELLATLEDPELQNEMAKAAAAAEAAQSDVDQRAK